LKLLTDLETINDQRRRVWYDQNSDCDAWCDK